MNDMKYRRLGDSGLVVSAVGLGANNFGMKLNLDECRSVLFAAIDTGITLIDTADVYENSEERIGELLPKERRGDVIIATKFGGPMHGRGGVGQDWDVRGSRRYIRRAVENSLRNLRTDWIDLYQSHHPFSPIEETLSALTDLIQEGKVRYIGHSNFSAWQTADADWIARTKGFERFISAQNDYSLLKREIENDLIPALDHFGIGLLPYFPLAHGLLTGKYERGMPPPPGSRVAHRNAPGNPKSVGRVSDWLLADDTFDVVDALKTFASERGVTILDVAFGGLLAQPAVASVIAGATSPEQIESNVKTLNWSPSPDDIASLNEITKSALQTKPPSVWRPK